MSFAIKDDKYRLYYNVAFALFFCEGWQNRSRSIYFLFASINMFYRSYFHSVYFYVWNILNKMVYRHTDQQYLSKDYMCVLVLFYGKQ